MAQVNLSEESERLLNISKDLYLDHHPEMFEIHISKNKMIYEALKFYLKNTEYEDQI